MEKAIKLVYKTTTDCENKMEMMNSIRKYLKRCEKARINNDRDTSETFCKAIDLIAEKLLKLPLTLIQVESINKSILKVKIYNEYLSMYSSAKIKFPIS